MKKFFVSLSLTAAFLFPVSVSAYVIDHCWNIDGTQTRTPGGMIVQLAVVDGFYRPVCLPKHPN